MTLISRFFCALNRAIHHCVVFTAGAFDYCNAIPEYTLWRRRAANVTERLLHRTGGLVRLLSLTWHISEACSQHQNWTGVEYGVLTDHVLSNHSAFTVRELQFASMCSGLEFSSVYHHHHHHLFAQINWTTRTHDQHENKSRTRRAQKTGAYILPIMCYEQSFMLYCPCSAVRASTVP